MNISGIRTSAGFYDYNIIRLNEVRSQQVKEAKTTEQEEISLNEVATAENVKPDYAEPVKSAGVDKGAEEFAKSYQPDAVYELKCVDSDITSLDMAQAISDLKKDQVLEQYQFFVGASIAQENEKLTAYRANENFYL